MLCDFGCGNEAIKTFKSGNHCCSDSTSRCSAMKARNNKRNTGEFNWLIIQEKYNSGLSQREICKLFSIPSATLYNAVKNRQLISRDRVTACDMARSAGKGKLTDDGRKRLKEKARERILQRYEQGWSPIAGRCKKYKYESEIAGEIYLDGTWELAVAQWLDKNKFEWKRNTTRFPYTNLKGTLSHYTPDFWVSELGGYLEVKGYETALDRCKWSQFTEPLTVWRKKDLKEKGMVP